MSTNISLFVNSISKESYLFWITLCFYFSLLITNPSNKIIALCFVLLFIVTQLKIKNISLSLLFTFVTSTILLTGKTYSVQLLPPDVFPIEIFPQGYFIRLVVTPSHIIAFIMFFLMLRKLVVDKERSKYLKTNSPETLLLIFFVLKILSALIGSKDPGLSLSAEILSLNGLVVYFFVKFFLQRKRFVWKLIIHVLAGLVVFESLLSFWQLAVKSPLFKNLESQVNIEYFGHAVDEPEFTFRPVGTFDHANFLGIWLAATILLLLITLVKENSAAVWIALWMGGATLIATLSRSAWLGAFSGILYLAVMSNINDRRQFTNLVKKVWRWKALLIPAILFLIVFFVLPRAEKSIYSFGVDTGAVFYRRIQILDAIEIIKLNPLFGVGALMGVYEGLALDLYTVAASIPLAVHNWYLTLALENGLPSLVVFILFLLVSLRKMWYVSDFPHPLKMGVTSFVICLLTSAFFQPYIAIDYIFLLLSQLNSDIIRPSKL